jgi:ketosteroid isomerase-like protein
MKKLVIYIVLLLMMMPALAQTKKDAAVAKAVEQLRKAMVEADTAMLDKLTSIKLSYGHSGGALDDKKTFVEKIRTGQSDFVDLDFKEQTITIDKNVAVVRHKLDAVTNDLGKPGEVHLRVLLVWQKQRGHWKLLARQAVKIQ